MEYGRVEDTVSAGVAPRLAKINRRRNFSYTGKVDGLVMPGSGNVHRQLLGNIVAIASSSSGLER
jgi:gamma-glutamyl-gamma-aminobutyrate hydrolase PuuD